MIRQFGDTQTTVYTCTNYTQCVGGPKKINAIDYSVHVYRCVIVIAHYGRSTRVATVVVRLPYLVILGGVMKVNGETSSGRLQPIPGVTDRVNTRLTNTQPSHQHEVISAHIMW